MYRNLEKLLSVENISLSYGQKKILKDVNFSIYDIARDDLITGQIVTLLGRSGVGKSQLFKIISGIIPPTSGIVRVTKEMIPTKPGAVGMVMQQYPLFGHRTLESNLLMVSKDKTMINELLGEFDLYQHKTKYPKSLSGGQRQRAAIVQQILCSNGFILLDEPFSGLDPVATDKLSNMILKVANQHENNTVVISSHILEPSMAISDRVLMLGKDDDVSGAYIKHEFNLAEMGLAWNPEILKNTSFINFVQEIRDIFKTL